MVTRIGWGGLYSRTEPLTNDSQPHEGRNFLGYPAMAGIRRQGRPVGWSYGHHVRLGDGQIPIVQVLTDLETNFPLVFSQYQPEVAFDFGTAEGGSALYFRQLMLRYCQAPLVVSVDMYDLLQGPCGPVHLKHDTSSMIKLIVGRALSSHVFSTIQEVCRQNRQRRILISLDDDHDADHVYRELELYSPLLRSADVILVQDTWNQGMHKHMFSPLLAVLRFVSRHPEFRIDIGLLRTVTLPCNFVHGVLVKE